MPTQEEIKYRTLNPQGGYGSISDEYLAGLFDGCGKIVSTKEMVKGKHERYPRIRIQILIPNVGVKITSKKKMAGLLERIKDFVVLNREQITLALQFCETINDEPRPLNKNERGLREIVYQRFRVLGEKK